MGDAAEEAIEEACQEIAEGAVSDAIDTMYAMCGNDGQITLIESVESEFGDQVDSIAEGDFEEVESDHPEAVGEITDVGNSICANAAELCDELRKI